MTTEEIREIAKKVADGLDLSYEELDALEAWCMVRIREFQGDDMGDEDDGEWNFTPWLEDNDEEPPF
jgi:hypothetical protein